MRKPTRPVAKPQKFMSVSGRTQERCPADKFIILSGKGESEVEEKRKKELLVGITLMILSSLSSCSGQLMWKLAAQQGDNSQRILYYALGFALYGIGALFMLIAFRFGELSVLHPMLSVGFILSIILGAAVLGESISAKKIAGIFLIIVGMVFLSRTGLKGDGS